MKLLSFLLFLVLLSCLVQCKPSRTGPELTWLGEYELKGYDNAGKLVFTGIVSLRSLENNHLIGQCTIKREPDAPMGLLDEHTRCEGMLDGKKVDMDLAPLLDDAGMLMEGQLDESGFRGVWMMDGFFTSPPLGKFEALKKSAIRIFNVEL